VITIPGFQAAVSLRSTTASPPPASDVADDSVRPAQRSRQDLFLDALRGARGEGYPAPVALDCPPGQRPTLVCVDSIPIIYIEWTSAGTYRCCVKRWECLPGGYEWQCQPIELREIGAPIGAKRRAVRGFGECPPCN
jgi:hypothetical protein